jgi:ubiquitin carboxyl-terminal hydrolase 8
MQPGVEQNGRSGSHQNGHHASSRTPRFPNIKDLQDEAASLDVNESTPVRIAFAMIHLEVWRWRVANTI